MSALHSSHPQQEDYPLTDHPYVSTGNTATYSPDSSLSSPTSIRMCPASPPPEIIHVAAYCRVSTEELVQEESLEAQYAHWEEVISTHAGWTLVEIYAEQGISGTHAETRPQLMQLIAACTERRVDQRGAGRRGAQNLSGLPGRLFTGYDRCRPQTGGCSQWHRLYHLALLIGEVCSDE